MLRDSNRRPADQPAEVGLGTITGLAGYQFAPHAAGTGPLDGPSSPRAGVVLFLKLWSLRCSRRVRPLTARWAAKFANGRP